MHGIIKCQHQGQMSESFPTAAERTLLCSVGSICNRHHCCRADTGKISECAEYPLEADCPATGNDSAVFGKLSSAKS